MIHKEADLNKSIEYIERIWLKYVFYVSFYLYNLRDIKVMTCKDQIKENREKEPLILR